MKPTLLHILLLAVWIHCILCLPINENVQNAAMPEESRSEDQVLGLLTHMENAIKDGNEAGFYEIFDSSAVFYFAERESSHVDHPTANGDPDVFSPVRGYGLSQFRAWAKPYFFSHPYEDSAMPEFSMPNMKPSDFQHIPDSRPAPEEHDLSLHKDTVIEVVGDLAYFQNAYLAGVAYQFSPATWRIVNFNITRVDTSSFSTVMGSHRSASSAISIWSFNIRYGTANDGSNSWPFRRKQVLDMLSSYAVDIYGMQEVLHFQLEEILKELDMYGYVGVGREDGAEAGEYAPILYRRDKYAVSDSGTFWFCATPDVPACTSYGNTLPRICTWALLQHIESGQAVLVYNVHLDHESQPSRVMSVKQLLAQISADASRLSTPPVVLVTGDFNAPEGTEEISVLLNSGFIDTYRDVHPDATSSGTFHNWSGSRDGGKIDYVFTPRGGVAAQGGYTFVHVESAAIVYDNIEGKYPSDHFPITANVVTVQQ